LLPEATPHPPPPVGRGRKFNPFPLPRGGRLGWGLPSVGLLRARIFARNSYTRGNCWKTRLTTIALTLTLTACAVGPDYKRPSVVTTPTFKEQVDWKTAQPNVGAIRGNWWAIYNDPLLDELIRQVDAYNQTLVKAEATYREAQALVESARAGLWPTIATTNFGETRSKPSSTTIAQPSAVVISRGVARNFDAPLTASWAPDFFGGVRRQIEENEASAQAAVGNYEVARLLAEATLAQDYFQLRCIDAQKKLYQDTVVAYRKSLQLTENQYKVGVAAQADVVNAKVQLKSAEAAAIDLDVLRRQLEHAIAVLTGKPPAAFTLPPAPLDMVPPQIPVGVPSDLLERRPDVAAAERQMASANASIGVAKAAFFPTVTLSATGGYQTAVPNLWFTTPSRFWSLGPSIAETFFDGGLHTANTKNAIATYDAAIANYRQTVLTAFQQIEDNLAALHVLEDEAKMQDEAIKLSRQAVTIALNQYKAGTVTYINVITAQATDLTNERAAFDILNRRMSASVLLVEYLGGGWDTSKLPDDKAIARDTYQPMPEVQPAFKPYIFSTPANPPVPENPTDAASLPAPGNLPPPEKLSAPVEKIAPPKP
jgi:NodT family efflux transporter outer membrane factor (OMF) lipoprotein